MGISKAVWHPRGEQSPVPITVLVLSKVSLTENLQRNACWAEAELACKITMAARRMAEREALGGQVACAWVTRQCRSCQVILWLRRCRLLRLRRVVSSRDRRAIFLIGGEVSDIFGWNPDRPRLVLGKNTSKAPPCCEEGVWPLPGLI